MATALIQVTNSVNTPVRSPSMGLSHLHSLTTASLENKGRGRTTLDIFSSSTLESIGCDIDDDGNDSVASLEEDDEELEEESPRVRPQHVVMAKEWGIQALQCLGYEPREVLKCKDEEVVQRAEQHDGQRSVTLRRVSSKAKTKLEALNEDNELRCEVQHPMIISSKGVIETRYETWFCTEWCADGNLEAYVEKHGHFAESVGRRLITQLLSGIAHLHQLGLARCDLRPKHIYLKRSATRLKVHSLGTKLNDEDSALAFQEDLRAAGLCAKLILCGSSVSAHNLSQTAQHFLERFSVEPQTSASDLLLHPFLPSFC